MGEKKGDRESIEIVLVFREYAKKVRMVVLLFEKPGE
jgi:hypothetical protein